MARLIIIVVQIVLQIIINKGGIMKYKVVEKKALIKRETWGYTYSNQIVKDYLSGELTRETDESMTRGFWDLAGEIIQHSQPVGKWDSKDIDQDELWCEIYYALVDVLEQTKKQTLLKNEKKYYKLQQEIKSVDDYLRNKYRAKILSLKKELIQYKQRKDNEKCRNK